jgi:hypothetical protein
VERKNIKEEGKERRWENQKDDGYQYFKKIMKNLLVPRVLF